MSRSDDLRDRLDELFSDDLEEKESRLSEIDQEFKRVHAELKKYSYQVEKSVGTFEMELHL